MTPRTTAGATAAATAAAAAPIRPSSGLKQSKKSPSPPPSRQSDTKPPSVSAKGVTSSNSEVPPAVPSTLPEFLELFLAKATTVPVAARKEQVERLSSAINWSLPMAEAGGPSPTLTGDGHLVLTVVPNEAQATISSSFCNVAITAGAPGKQLCRTDEGNPNRILLAPLNHAGGSRDPLPVSWADGLSWSVDAKELRLAGTGACPTGGASIQRGCVTLTTSTNGARATISVVAPSSGGNKAAVVTADLATTVGDKLDEVFTHAGDESVTKFTLLSDSSTASVAAGKRPPSGSSAESRRRRGRVSVMDSIAQFDGDIDALTKRFVGRGAFTITTGSSTSAKYDGEWSDSLRHSAKGHWSMALPSSSAQVVSSVEYTGPFHNDSRHGKAGRLTIRKQSSAGGPGGGLHIDADWEHGELDGTATLSSVEDTQTIVSCGFTAGTVAPNVTMTFPSGAFVGKWANPKSVASASIALASSTPTAAASTSAVPLPVELLQQSAAGVLANVTKAADAIGAVDCVIQSIANPLLADQIRGPVAEFLASRVACDLTKANAIATITSAQLQGREKQLELIRNSLKEVQVRLAEQQQLLAKAEKKRNGLVADRDKAVAALDKAAQQRDAALSALENAESGHTDGVDKMKLAQQALRALGLEKSSIEQHITELNDQIASLKADAKKCAQKRDASIKELKSIEAETLQHTDKLSAMSTLIDAQVTKLASLEQEAEAAQSKLEISKQSAGEQLAQLQRQLASLNDSDALNTPRTTENVEAAIKETKGNIARLKKSVEEAEQQKLTEETRKRDLHKKSTSDEKLREELQSELDRLTAGVEASKLSLSSKRQEIETMGATLAGLESEHQRLRDASESGLPGGPQDPEDHVSKRAVLEKELATLTDDLAQRRSLMTKRMMELDAMRSTIERLEAELADAKRIAMKPPVVPDEPKSPLEKSMRSPAPPSPPPARVATPPPDPRIAQLEDAIKISITKQDGFRRKKENIVDRIDQLAKQKVSLEAKMARKAKDDAEEAAALNRTSSNVAASHDGGLNAMLLDGSIPELKAFLAKMKQQNAQYEDENQTLKQKLDALSNAVADAKKQSTTASGFPQSQGTGVDWRTKALQDEVDLREGRISALRSELKRIHLLEAKIQAAKESIKTLTQSAELRQTQAVQMAKAEMDWTSSVTLARRASSGRNAFF